MGVSIRGYSEAVDYRYIAKLNMKASQIIRITSKELVSNNLTRNYPIITLIL